MRRSETNGENKGLENILQKIINPCTTGSGKNQENISEIVRTRSNKRKREEKRKGRTISVMTLSQLRK
jgi:hypothetical protein